jgi:ATP-dependent exoDNAse (exonuclease V) alpha subunit
VRATRPERRSAEAAGIVLPDALQRRPRCRVAHRYGGRRARRCFDGHEVIYGFSELDELVLAYATTIHKSQGSEYPAVVIPLTTQHYPMLQRNLVYTGVTRGKRLVVVVGQRKALAIAVKGARARRRWSKLRDWLSR